MNVLSTFTLVVIEFVYNVQMKLIENVKKKNCTPSEKEMVWMKKQKKNQK